MKRLAASITEEGLISGYGSIFGAVDSYGSVMMPGCFADSLAKHSADGTAPKGLWQHEFESPILVWTEVAEDETGLRCSGKLILEVEKAREALALYKSGAIEGLSIGFDYVDREDVPPDEAAARGFDLDPERVNPETGMFEFVHAADLWEISLVTFNSCPDAVVDEVRRQDVPHDDAAWRDLQLALAERGDRLRRF